MNPSEFEMINTNDFVIQPQRLFGTEVIEGRKTSPRKKRMMRMNSDPKEKRGKMERLPSKQSLLNNLRSREVIDHKLLTQVTSLQ